MYVDLIRMTARTNVPPPPLSRVLFYW